MNTRETRSQLWRRIEEVYLGGRAGPNERQSYGTGLEAVYYEGFTTALRDLLPDVEREFEPRVGAWLRDWAAARGIEIEDDER